MDLSMKLADIRVRIAWVIVIIIIIIIIFSVKKTISKNNDSINKKKER